MIHSLNLSPLWQQQHPIQSLSAFTWHHTTHLSIIRSHFTLNFKISLFEIVKDVKKHKFHSCSSSSLTFSCRRRSWKEIMNENEQLHINRAIKRKIETHKHTAFFSYFGWSKIVWCLALFFFRGLDDNAKGTAHTVASVHISLFSFSFFKHFFVVDESFFSMSLFIILKLGIFPMVNLCDRISIFI